MSDRTLLATLEEKSKALRRHILKMASNGQIIHVGGSMSIVEMMSALFFHFLELEGKDRAKDHFILSKGHTVHAYHACLAELGYVEEDEFLKLGQPGTRLAGHPSLKAPLVEVATGSLGHGLSVGLGICMAEKLDNSEAKTVVLMGDGEMQEGSIWEAALCAPRFGTENLLAIVDANRFQASGAVSDILPVESLVDKWKSFNWNTHMVDGHNLEQILDVFNNFPAEKGPTVIIANTIKGKGVPSIEGTAQAHFTMLDETAVEDALKLMEEV